jgi:hypothetical protein
MKIGKIIRLNDDASVGLLKESNPLGKEIPFDFTPKEYIFSYGKIENYREREGGGVKELVKRGLGVNTIVVFWIDKNEAVEKVAPVIFS